LQSQPKRRISKFFSTLKEKELTSLI